MVIKRLGMWLCLCGLGVGFASGLQAQESAALLLLNIDRQVYRWSPGDSQPVPVGCDLQGNELRLVLVSLLESPDGHWTAFNVVPLGTGFTAPTATGNLWVCNIDTGAAYALSDTDPGFPNFVSEGAFSPDGSQIAWTEVAGNSADMNHARVMIHDFATRATRVLVDSTPFDEPCGVGQGAPRLVWGDAGIAMGYYRTPENDFCGELVEVGFYVYDPVSGARASYPIPDTRYAFDLFEWVQIDGTPHLVYQYLDYMENRFRIYSIDIAQGSVNAVNGYLEAYSPSSSGRYLVPELEYGNVPPLIYPPGSGTPFESAADVAFAPDGSQMAVLLGKRLYFAGQGNLEPTPWNQTFYPISDANGGLNIPETATGQLEIAWAAPQYRLIEGDIPASLCPPVEAIYYADIGGSVVPGLGANNLRSAPWPGAPVLGTIPESGSLIVLDSLDFSPYQMFAPSVCTDNTRWREVMYGDVVGWTAEAQGDSYYLQPGP